MSSRFSVAYSQMEANGWMGYDEGESQELEAKPDPRHPCCNYCLMCASRRVQLIVKRLPTTAKLQFKSLCQSCGFKSEAIPHFLDKKRAESICFWFGKHKGETLGSVHQSDPEYIDWCRENLSDHGILRAIEALLGDRRVADRREKKFGQVRFFESFPEGDRQC